MFLRNKNSIFSSIVQKSLSFLIGLIVVFGTTFVLTSNPMVVRAETYVLGVNYPNIADCREGGLVEGCDYLGVGLTGRLNCGSGNCADPETGSFYSGCVSAKTSSILGQDIFTIKCSSKKVGYVDTQQNLRCEGTDVWINDSKTSCVLSATKQLVKNCVGISGPNLSIGQYQYMCEIEAGVGDSSNIFKIEECKKIKPDQCERGTLIGETCASFNGKPKIWECKSTRTGVNGADKVKPAEECTYDAAAKTCTTKDGTKVYVDCEGTNPNIKCNPTPKTIVDAGADATCVKDATGINGTCTTKDGKTLTGCNGTKCTMAVDTSGGVKDSAASKDNCGLDVVCFIMDIVLKIITVLIWGFVQIAKFFLGILGGMFVVLISINPASNSLLDIAYPAWQTVLNVSNIVLLAGILFMGFGYILNIPSVKSKGLQEFFLGILVIGVMMPFTFAAAATVVNFSNGLGNIIYFGAGGIANQSLLSDTKADPKLISCLTQAKEANGGDSGVSFVSTFICNVSQVSKATADAESGQGNLTSTLGTIFQDKSSTGLVTIAIVLAIYGLAILSFFQVIFVLLVRIFGVWMLIVVSPLALVAFFSPLPSMKDLANKWADNFFKLSFAYPFYTFGITLVTMIMGNLGSAIRLNAVASGLEKASVGSGSINTYAAAGEGLGGVVGNYFAPKFSEEVISSIIVALFSFGLVYAFGKLFWSIFSGLWSAAKSAAGALYNYGGKQVAGVGLGIANKTARGISKIPMGDGTVGSNLTKFTNSVGAKALAGTAGFLEDKNLNKGILKKGVEGLKLRADRARNRAENAKEISESWGKDFTIQGAFAGIKTNTARNFDFGLLDRERIQRQKKRTDLDYEAKKMLTPGGRAELAALGLNSFADLDVESDDFGKDLQKRKAFLLADARKRYDRASSDGNILKKRAEEAKQALERDPNNADKAAILAQRIEDTINGPGGLGHLQDDLIIQEFLKRKEVFANFSEETKKKFLGDDNSFGQYAHLLDNDALTSEILQKGGNQKALKELNLKTLSNSNFQELLGKTFGSDYLSQNVGKDALKNAGYGAGVLVPPQIEDQAKSRIRASIASGSNRYAKLSQATAIASGLSRNMGDFLPNLSENFIQSNLSDPNLVEKSSATGRYGLTENGIKELKNQAATQAFGDGDGVSDTNELRGFLDNTELGRKLKDDATFQRLQQGGVGNEIIEYADLIKRSYKDSFNEDINNHTIENNLGDTASAIGALIELEEQSKPAIEAYGSATKFMTAKFKADTNIDRGSQEAAKELFNSGEAEKAAELLALSEAVKGFASPSSTPSAALNVEAEKRAKEFITLTEQLSTVAPGEKAKLMQEIVNKGKEITAASPTARAAINAKTDEIKMQATKASAQIEAQYLHKEIDRKTGISYVDSNGATGEIKKKDLAKLKQTKAELSTDAAQYISARASRQSHTLAFEGIKRRLERVGADSQTIIKYSSMLDATFAGQINGRNQSQEDRTKRALGSLGATIGKAENLNRVGSALSEASNNIVDFNQQLIETHQTESQYKANFAALL